jgi:hypothetical protein
MIDNGTGWDIDALPHIDGQEIKIIKSHKLTHEQRGAMWFLNELRNAIFPPTGRDRDGIHYILDQWKTALWESRWIRKSKKEDTQIRAITDDEERRLYQIPPYLYETALKISHCDKKHVSQLMWPASIPRPTRLDTPILRRYLIKPRDEIMFHGRLTSSPRAVVAYDISLVRPRLHLLTHRDWLRLLLNGSVVGIALYVVSRRYGDQIRQGDLLRKISGSYVKALLQLQLVVVIFNVYTFGPQAIEYVLSSILPMPKHLVPSWIKDLQDYIWMALFGYWAVKNVVMVDPQKANFIQKMSRDWLTNYGSYLAECYGYMFAADCGLRTLPVMFKLQRRALLYVRQSFSLLKSSLVNKWKK